MHRTAWTAMFVAAAVSVAVNLLRHRGRFARTAAMMMTLLAPVFGAAAIMQ